MTVEELIEKGLVKVCDKHGDENPIYYEASQECPICKAEDAILKEVSESKKTKIRTTPRKITEQPQPVKKQEPQKKGDFIDQVQSWWNKQTMVYKIVLIAGTIVILWVCLNLGAIMSYFS